jgi:hypothetical protein
MTFAVPRQNGLEAPAFPAFNGGLRDLFSTLDDLLACGGDPRLMLDPISRLNDYGCGAAPAPHMLSFASSTASAISEHGYERAGLAREELMRSAISVGLEQALDDRIEAMRGELKAHLALADDGADVVFSPSGTDSQLHALFVARAWLGPKLATIVVGSDQTGSGTAYTARGRHFNRFTASGATVRKDTAIADLVGEAVMLPLSDATGVRMREDADAAVLAAVDTAVQGGSRVLLQIMDASKLGWRAPSAACLDEIARRWPTEVIVLVDACQMRLSRRRLGLYLERGYLVLVTGSKFFGGPAFSGALLVPPQRSLELAASCGGASGLAGYASRSDWPQRWRGIRAGFESRANFGQWLRWEAALDEIRDYYDVPAAFRAMALRELSAGIESLIALSPSLRLIGGSAGFSRADDEEFCEATILPFTIERGGRALSATDCRVLYQALAQDLSGVIKATSSDRDILARRCLLGQPVRIERKGLEPTAALRLCVGARAVTENWSSDPVAAAKNLHRELDHVAETIAKIELLLTHTDMTELTELSHGD